MNKTAYKILVWIISILIIFPANAQQELSESARDKEYKVKAAFVYNFMKFVEWEGLKGDKSFEDSKKIILAVIGTNPFEKKLDSLSSKKIKDKTIEVKYYDYSDLSDNAKQSEIKQSHTVFACASENSDYERLLALLKDKCTLTIGDESNFIAKGGIIGFDIEKGKVCFDVNYDSAKESGIKINAKILKLARKVQKGK